MSYLDIMKSVLIQESDAIRLAAERLILKDIKRLESIFQELLISEGSLIFLGVGKSGQIGEKLAATFSSLGLSSYSLHPTDALHGDLGRVKNSDYFVLISKSGTTEEIFKLLPFLSSDKDRFIGLLGNKESVLANRCELVFDCSVEREACLNNQAPTTSTTLALAMGDAMAVVFEKIAGLSKEGFAVNHPGGNLGKSLLMKVSDLMWVKDKCAFLEDNSTFRALIVEMTKCNLGGCAVVDKEKFLGIIVEGDFRRAFASGDCNLDSSISNIVNRSPISITPDSLAIDALKLMESPNREINILPVLDDNKNFLGFIRLHDLLKEGLSSNN